MHSTEPPDANKGGSQPPIAPVSHCIDWLSYSVPWPEDGPPGPDNLARAALLPHEALYLTGEALAPRRGYNRALGASVGRLDWHDERPDQRIGVTLTGRDLAALAGAGVDVGVYLAWLSGVGARVTRIDGAIDYRRPADPDDLITAWQAGQVTTRMQSIHQWTRYPPPDKPDAPAGTIYLGSPSSDRRIRVYNKAAQLDQPGPWFRLEVVNRRAYAPPFVQAALAYGTDQATRAAITGLVACSLAWWQDALSGPTAYLAPVSHVPGDTVRWLATQCLPALRRVLVESDPDAARLARAFQDVLSGYWARTAHQARLKNHH